MSGLMRIAVLVCASCLVSCKVVNTHTFKLTGSAEFENTGVHLQTTTGSLYLENSGLGEKGFELLRGLKPFQCLSVTTSQPFDMKDRVVRFSDFRLKKLPDGDSACRKIPTRTVIRVSAG